MTGNFIRSTRLPPCRRERSLRISEAAQSPPCVVQRLFLPAMISCRLLFQRRDRLFDQVGGLAQGPRIESEFRTRLPPCRRERTLRRSEAAQSAPCVVQRAFLPAMI